jgi:hypothetical protein
MKGIGVAWNQIWCVFQLGMSQKVSVNEISAPCRFSRQERKIGGQKDGRNFLDPCWLVQQVNKISLMVSSIHGAISFTVRTRRTGSRPALKAFSPSISLTVHARWTGSGGGIQSPLRKLRTSDRRKIEKTIASPAYVRQGPFVCNQYLS